MTDVLLAPTPRLTLGSPDSDLTLLDGGWWPRSTDPEAELPALILAIDHLHGTVRRMALGADGWSARPRFVMAGGRRVRLGFFASQPASLLTAQCADGGRVDLLVVAPQTTEAAALSAMAAAAAPGDMLPMPQITRAQPDRAGRLSEQVWETDGGHPLGVRRRSIADGPSPEIGVQGHDLVRS
jgi:hypothetical protein